MMIDHRSPLPKYRQLAEFLETEIRGGKGEIGKRFASEREIIRESGLSIVTVRQALDQLARKGLLRREPGLGTYLVRREPAPQEVRHVGLFVFGLADEVLSGYGFLYSQWMQGLLSELKAGGRCLSILDIEPDDDAKRVVAGYVEDADRWAGFIFGEAGDWLAEPLGELLSRRAPHVVLHRFPWVGGANAVYADHRSAGRLAGEHLLSLGHRRIAYVGHLRDERFEGFCEELRRAGCAPAEGLARGDRCGSIAESIESGACAARGLLAASPRPTAIFAMNDARALGALNACREMGIRVPEDLSLIGVDDMAEGARASPPLTTIRLPWPEVGRRGAQALLAWERAGAAYRPAQVALPPERIVRASTGPAGVGR